MEKTLAENSVKKEYSPRKKFAAAKRVMGDAHCDDQESSHDLQKQMKLSNQKFTMQYVQCAREGTTKLLATYRNSPVLEHDEEWKVGIPPFYPDMQR